MSSMEEGRRFPIATVIVLSATAVITALQFSSPRVLITLRRTPGALSSHQWWRLFTPMFVHSDGWSQIAFNFISIAIIGTIVEKLYGWQPWLGLYFVSGMVGEIVGLVWQPYGAGASVAGSGLLGGLAASLLRKGTVQGRLGGGCILAFAVALTLHRDIHGPPILVGSCLAFTRLPRNSTSRTILSIQTNHARQNSGK